MGRTVVGRPWPSTMMHWWMDATPLSRDGLAGPVMMLPTISQLLLELECDELTGGERSAAHSGHSG